MGYRRLICATGVADAQVVLLAPTVVELCRRGIIDHVLAEIVYFLLAFERFAVGARRLYAQSEGIVVFFSLCFEVEFDFLIDKIVFESFAVGGVENGVVAFGIF